MKHQQIHRSVSAMAFRLTEAIQTKAHQADDYALREVELQYQIDIAGEVGSTAGGRKSRSPSRRSSTTRRGNGVATTTSRTCGSGKSSIAGYPCSSMPT
jgi:hypothetical protein